MTAQRLVILGVLIAATFALFARWPGLDLWTTGLFYDPPTGFGASQGIANGFRVVHLAVVRGAARRGHCRPRPRPLDAQRPVRLSRAASGPTSLLLYLLGPGLLVDATLKPVWGRARPADVTQFGGTLTFTPPHVISGACTRNCSFTAGEVAGAVALSVSVWLILRCIRPRMQPIAYTIGATACILIPVLIAPAARRGRAPLPVGYDPLCPRHPDRRRGPSCADVPRPPEGDPPPRALLLTTPATPPIRRQLETRRPHPAAFCASGSEV